MYQALYRKYRPKNLDEVIGQDIIISTLKNTIRKNKISHAYLFTGPRGTGKTSVAKILAKTINCLNLNDYNPCNQCVNCTQYNNKQNIDIIEIDAASNNGVDEIRELKSKVNLVPSVGKYKIYIIDEVHMLTVGAFNALLKTLEEPPAHIIFILATTEPHKIPATILSRCQRFDFKKIRTSKIEEYLEHIIKNENIKATKEALTEIAKHSDGGLRDAISILDQVIAYSSETIKIEDVNDIVGSLSKNEIYNLILQLVEENKKETFNLIKKYDADGKNFIKISEELANFLKNTLLYNISEEIIEDTEDYYKKILNVIDVNKIQEILDIVIKSINDMKQYSEANFIFEILIIKLLDVLKKENDENSNLQKNKEENIIKMSKTENNDQLNVNTKENEELNNIIEKYKEIRINNTLAQFDKKYTLNLKNKLDVIQSYIIDPETSKAANIIIDGELKAASKDNIIFVYKTKNLANIFNYNLIEIEELLTRIYDKHHNLIATDIDSWEKIKKVFNSKQKKYELININDDLIEMLKEKQNQNQNDIEKMFDEIIEYN